MLPFLVKQRLISPGSCDLKIALTWEKTWQFRIFWSLESNWSFHKEQNIAILLTSWVLSASSTFTFPTSIPSKKRYRLSTTQPSTQKRWWSRCICGRCQWTCKLSSWSCLTIQWKKWQGIGENLLFRLPFRVRRIHPTHSALAPSRWRLSLSHWKCLSTGA